MGCMKNGATNGTSIDDLAVMVARGFERTATKEDLKELEKKLTGEIEGVKNQLEGTNKRIDSLAETKVSKVTHRELESRVSAIERKM